jgi:hypothetical protein
MWKDFVHLDDGIHPDPDTTKRAARRVAREITRVSGRD